MDRRIFISMAALFMGIVAAGAYFFKKFFNFDLTFMSNAPVTQSDQSDKPTYILSENIRGDSETYSRIFESKNGTPGQNMSKVLEMLGGIETIIDKNDIVILKPNGQQVGHNMTNTNTMKAFIDQVLTIHGFNGEIIIAENHHHIDCNSAGWTTQYRNGDFNLNELVDYYHDKGINNVSKYHWRDAGAVPDSRFTLADPGRIVSGPDEGDGYVWTDYDYTYNGKKTKMNYPIFTSTCSGVTIDFKNGAWKNGRYTGQPIKFINISALRNHSNAGVTATIKNYLGVVDLSCGYHGIKPSGYYNFHYIAVDWPTSGLVRDGMKHFITSQFAEKQKTINKIAKYVGPQNGAMGSAVGFFMRTIRKADLNIIAAEYAGHEGRHNIPAHIKTVLASTDPVALDYYAGKYVLVPLGGKRVMFNNPDNRRGTFRKTLDGCHDQGIGTLDEKEMILHKYDFKAA